MIEQPYVNKLNPDIATEEQLTQNNDELIDYLADTGEADASEQVDKLRERANAAKAQAKAPGNNIFNKKMLAVSTDIRDILKDIRDNQIDEQDTSIKASPKVEDALPAIAASAMAKDGDGNILQGEGENTGSGFLGAFGAMSAGAMSTRLLSLARNPATLAALATAGTLAYIGSEVSGRYEQFETSNVEAERTEAAVAASTGLAGAAAGAWAGFTAMGTIGAIVGNMGFPIVGGLIGGVSAGITGAAAGAALGYYMGDKVGEYIADVWSGPLERIPDEQRNNPFTLHNYLTNALIPEMERNKARALSMSPAERAAAEEETGKDLDPENIQNGIDEFTALSQEALTPDFIQDWMVNKLELNNLDDENYQVQRRFLNNIMDQFKDTPYYEMGIPVIPEAAPEPGAIATGLASALDMVGLGEDDEDRAEAERKLEEANRIENFNTSNTLGEGGTAITLSRDWDNNYDILVRNGILSDDWGKNSIADRRKLEQLPLPVLRGILSDGYMDEPSTQILQNLIKERATTTTTTSTSVINGVMSTETTVTGGDPTVDIAPIQGMDRVSNMGTGPAIPAPYNVEGAPRDAETGTVGRLDGFRATVEQVQNGIRGNNVSPELERILQIAGTAAGVNVRVTSGGQMPLAEAQAAGATTYKNSQDQTIWSLNGRDVRIGSTRHDGGRAADIELLDRDGNVIRAASEDPRVIEFISAAVAAGAEGVGAGEGYMSGTRLHVDTVGTADGGSRTWGRGSRSANTPEFLAQAYAAGANGSYQLPTFDEEAVDSEAAQIGADAMLAIGATPNTANGSSVNTDIMGEAPTEQQYSVDSNGNLVTAQADANKQRREVAVFENAYALAQTTREYESGTRVASVGMNNININNNNRIQPPAEDNVRPLAVFA